jgi:hypothetical protein
MLMQVASPSARSKLQQSKKDSRIGNPASLLSSLIHFQALP